MKPHRQGGAAGWRWILVGGAAAIALAAAAVPTLLERGSQRLGREIGDRLADALGGTCTVGGVRLVSLREVELEAVGCVMDEGPLLGFAAGSVGARFPQSPLRGALPPADLLTVDDLRVRLRDLPSFGAVVPRAERPPAPGDETPAADASARLEPAPPAAGDEAPSADASARLERECLRFLAFSRAMAEGAGGARLPSLRERLGAEGTLRIDGATLELADGDELVRDVTARVGREAGGLALTVAAELPAGGIVGLDGQLTDRGLRRARIRLERVDVASALDRAGGDDLSVQAGVTSGTLSWSGDGGTAAWSLELGLDGLVVQTDALGAEPLPLPHLGVVGRVLADDAGGRLGLLDGRWSVATAGGTIYVQLGPLGGDGEAMAEARIDASGLPLGELLGSLPDALLPHRWAREIQGTLDAHLTFRGPLHDRKRWALDWQADFSRLFLASGELATQVDALRGPFPHTFPPREEGGAPIERIIGPGDPSFVALADISPHVVNAVVSTEDAGFFKHSGFEVSELKEAMLENLREGGGRGGSTITQQLAKNLFLSGERTLSRKLKEAVIAWRMEADLPKDRILEIYLNIAEWGPGLYGIRDAADHYFARRPSVLRPEEAAFLASLLPSPRRYHRYYHTGRGLTANRQERVQEILRTMHRMGRLSDRDYHLARGVPLELAWCRFEAR